jgi:hypothetical protein
MVNFAVSMGWIFGIGIAAYLGSLVVYEKKKQ